MMATITGGAKLESYLANLLAKSKGATKLEVGFFAGATYPDGTSVALVAATQNFGSRTIPPRPFFSNMVAEKSPQWGAKVAALLEHNEGNSKIALEQMGLEIVGELKDSIVATNTPPLSPITIARKGFDKPLIDTSHMLNSIGSRVS